MKYHRTNFHYKMHSCLRNIYGVYSHISLLKPAISRSRRRVRANVCKSCTGAITYTPAGELSSIRSPSGLLVSYLRNATGQISGLQTKTGMAASLPTTNFITNLQYTAWQQPQAWQWAGMGSTSTATISSASRSFDADGRMTANQVASYQFDAASRITSITQNLIAQRTVTTGTGTATTTTLQNYTTPVKWTVGYDNRDRVVSFNRVDGGATTGQTSQYTYDPNSNRLTSINQTTTDTDKDGLFEANEVRKNTAQTLTIGTGSNQLLGFSQVLTTVTGTKTNAVVNSTVNYTLDPAGNLTSDGLRSFAYDTTNRLSTVTLGSTFVGTDTIAGNELASQSYLHNALGQRVFKSEPRTQVNPPNSSTLSPDFVTWLKNNFSWLWATAQTNATLGDSYNHGEPSAQLPSWALLGEYGNGGASSTGRTEYIWLPTEDGSGGGAIPVGMVRSSKFYAIHTDHLGTPRLITDNTNTPVWQWAYSAFGDNAPTGILKPTTNAAGAYLSLPATAGSGTTTATLLAVSAPAQVFNLRFPGQYSDSETGSFYNYYRTYQASQGRYTQPDPIGLNGGWSRFGYTNANSFSYSDPFGLDAAGQAIGTAIGTWGGRIGGAAIGTLIEPGGGTAAGGMVGGAIGGRVGGIVGSAIGDMCRSDRPDECGPDDRQTAMMKAYAWAGISIGGQECQPIPWNFYNNKNSKGYAQARQDGSACMGYKSSSGSSVEEHPGGHNDDNAPHHKCAHFHATNSSGAKTIFTYKLK